MFKRDFIILLFLTSAFCFSQQDDFIFGQLVDSTQNEPIPFASIRIKEKALGVITNIDGTFKIPLRYNEMGEVLEISCLGYETKEMNIQDLDDGQSNIIILKPSALELEGAVVSANIKKLSAKQIVKIAIQSIPQNYPRNTFGLVGYYRDYQVKNANYTNLSEALIKVVDEGFGKRTSFYNQHQLLSQSENSNFEIDSFAKQPYDYEGFNKIVPNAKMKNDGGNEFIILTMHDAIRNYKEPSFSFIENISKDFIETHRFRLIGKKRYKDQMVYEIDGTYRNLEYLARVKIFVNTEDFAIHKLDYTVYKRKKPNERDLAINPKERFSDGFRKLNNEILYHILTEYVHGANGKMFLNYISFYNKVLVQRPAEFFSKFTIDLSDTSFKIRVNKIPSALSKIKNRDFKIKYKNTFMPIKEFWFREDERMFVVCPHMLYKKEEDLFKELFAEREDLLVADMEYSFGNITDSLGNKIDERKWEYLHQYREFFTQEVQASGGEIDKNDLMIKGLPLDSELQPISNKTMKSNYWKNTPLPTLKNKKTASD